MLVPEKRFSVKWETNGSANDSLIEERGLSKCGFPG